jgi:hypothetical protein
MAQINWVTPAGDLVNLLVGSTFSESLLALNPTNTNDTITYQVIGGSLPIGISLASNGILSGTPTTTDTYFTTQTYSFIVRANGTNVTPADQQFSIIITNSVNSDFYWITKSGTLGTLPNGEFYQLPLETSQPATFSFISGQLPPGLQVVKAGYLQGVPTLLNSIAVDTAESFRFTIRATNSQGHIRDQAFSLSVTNVYGPVIEPSTTFLGSFFDGTYFSQQLEVNELNPNVSITWSNIGSLPPGITLSSTGLLSGYIQPIQLVGAFGPAGYDGQVDASGIIDAGNLTVGLTYTIQTLGNTDFTKVGAAQNTIGTVFTANSIASSTTGTASFITNLVEQNQEYDFGPYDFNQVNQSVSYSFSIRAYDGANYDLQNYIINVASRSNFTADNGTITVDNSFLTVDSGNVYIPVILNANVTTLPTGRASSFYAFKFNGYDFQNDTITYSLVNSIGTFDALVPLYDDGFDFGGVVGFDSFDPESSPVSNLPGLNLDSATGWIYGRLNAQPEAYKTYSFGVQVKKVRDGQPYYGIPDFVNLPVLGDVNNIIEWITPSNLGTINNGSVSELYVEAVSLTGKDLVYSLLDKAGVKVRLPQGLELLPSGEISGRVSFEAFSIDDYATTFDGGKLTIDRNYTFTVQVATSDGSASSTKQFTLTLDIIDIEPYDNLYLKAMPAFDQRQIYNSVISNTEIFVPSLIYRPTDPWFGIQKDIELLFLPGLTPSELNTYANAIVNNHYTKTYNFGDIKTAVVLDENYEVKYEVIYIDVIDPALNSSGNGPGVEIDLNNIIANPYIDINGTEYKTVYPNTSQDMKTRLEDGVGFYDQSSLPPWMTSNQLGTGSATFNPPLGYTRAVVLAYTKPGASNLISYRLRNSGINFNNIEFTVDRYLLDDFYTKNFNDELQRYILGRETTFDALPHQNIGSIVATVNYGLTATPFDQVDGRPVTYINANGGLDGITTYQDGDTLIFVQQENYLNGGAYDGWVKYLDVYFGDNISTPSIEGYGVEEYDPYSIVPGFLEKNQRSVASATTTATAINITTETVTYTGDGNATTFPPNGGQSLDATATSATVTINGILVPVVEYTIGGGSIIFVTPPPNGSTISVTTNSPINLITVNSTKGIFPGASIVFTGSSFGNITPNFAYNVTGVIDATHITISAPSISFASDAFTGDGVTTNYTLGTTSTTGTTAVFVNEQQLVPGADYTVSGTNLNFIHAPVNNSNIVVKIYLQSNPLTAAVGSMTVNSYSNQRGGVWQIKIVNGIVNLVFVQEISVNDRVRILFGNTYAGAVVYYNQTLSAGITVPYYSIYKLQFSTINIKRTTFNGDTTKFFSNRDSYYTPGENDKYIKFPQYGVFN